MFILFVYLVVAYFVRLASERMTRSAGFWHAVLVWSLVPGNVLAIVMIIALQRQGAVQQSSIVYRHVFHTRAGEVWKPSDMPAESLEALLDQSRHGALRSHRVEIEQHHLQVRRDLPSDLNTGQQQSKSSVKSADALADGNDGEELGREEEEEPSSVNYELMYLWKDSAQSLNGNEFALPSDSGPSELDDNLAWLEQPNALHVSAEIQSGIATDSEDDNDLPLDLGDDVDDDQDSGDDDDEEEDGDDDEEEDVGEGEASAKSSAGFIKLVKQVKPSNRNTFYSYRSSGCSQLCEQLKADKWIRSSKSPAIALIHGYANNAFDKFKYQKRSAVNFLGPSGAGCIGGSNAAQLRCRQEFARKFGCEYNSVGLQPRTWNVQDLHECRALSKYASALDESKIFLQKQYSTAGSTFMAVDAVHNDTLKFRALKGGCKKKSRDAVLIEEYVKDLVAVDGKFFTMRTFLLVASADPLLAFFHDGLALIKDKPAGAGMGDTAVNASGTESEEDPLAAARTHITALTSSQHSSVVEAHKFLDNVGGSDALYANFFQKAKRGALIALHSAKIERHKGRFQLFAMDWQINQQGEPILLDVAGDVPMIEYAQVPELADLYTSMINLVKAVQIVPDTVRIPTRGKAFTFAKWQLLYNELAQDAQVLNPCKYHNLE